MVLFFKKIFKSCTSTKKVESMSRQNDLCFQLQNVSATHVNKTKDDVNALNKELTDKFKSLFNVIFYRKLYLVDRGKLTLEGSTPELVLKSEKKQIGVVMFVIDQSSYRSHSLFKRDGNANIGLRVRKSDLSRVTIFSHDYMFMGTNDGYITIDQPRGYSFSELCTDVEKRSFELTINDTLERLKAAIVDDYDKQENVNHMWKILGKIREDYNKLLQDMYDTMWSEYHIKYGEKHYRQWVEDEYKKQSNAIQHEISRLNEHVEREATRAKLGM